MIKRFVLPNNKKGTLKSTRTSHARGPFSNKKGDKIISIYWFVVLTIIAGGIILMANAFYGTPYDVRPAEAKILSGKVADCIYFGGVMNKDLIASTGAFKSEFNDNFLNRCSLNFDFKEEFSGVEYYVGVNFFVREDSKEPEFSIDAGNKNWIADCEVETGKKLVECYDNEFWSNSPAGKSYLVKIKSIIKKTEKNVK